MNQQSEIERLRVELTICKALMSGTQLKRYRELVAEHNGNVSIVVPMKPRGSVVISASQTAYIIDRIGATFIKVQTYNPRQQHITLGKAYDRCNRTQAYDPSRDDVRIVINSLIGLGMLRRGVGTKKTERKRFYLAGLNDPVMLQRNAVAIAETIEKRNGFTHGSA